MSKKNILVWIPVFVWYHDKPTIENMNYHLCVWSTKKGASMSRNYFSLLGYFESVQAAFSSVCKPECSNSVKGSTSYD